MGTVRPMGLYLRRTLLSRLAPAECLKESPVPCQWFFTRSDGTRAGPFSPLALNGLASTDHLQASPRVRKGRVAKPASAKRLSLAATGTKATKPLDTTRIRFDAGYIDGND